MPASCDPRRRRASALPIPPAPGIGGRLKTPAKQRPSFLRKYGRALFRKADSPASRLAALTQIAGLLPAQTGRSEESQPLQQFSTPVTLGLPACTAPAITPADCVLEPSAGTGLLAILAEIAGGALVLNELADTRATLLDHLFPGVTVTRFDAAQIDDHLAPSITPTVMLMNPPFSAMANVDRRMADAAYRMRPPDCTSRHSRGRSGRRATA
jgi:predicted RNA methylase